MIANILRSILALVVIASIVISAWLHYQAGWPWLLALSVGSLVPLLGHAGLLGSEFVLAAWLGRHASLPANATRHRMGGLIRASLSEIPVALRFFVLRMPWFGARPLASASSDGPVPVVLVPGYLCNRALFGPMAEHLARAGHAVESVNLEPFLGSIDDYPELIHAAVLKARNYSATGSVAMIGHSMGGVAIRAYLRDYEHSPDQAHGDQVITLGSPHHGTALAKIGHTQIVRELQTDSDWLRALAENEPAGRFQRFTVILSEHDNIVTPQRSQTLTGARTVAFAGLGHVELACHQAVFSLITEVLEDRPTATTVDGSPADLPEPRTQSTGLRSTAEIKCERPA